VDVQAIIDLAGIPVVERVLIDGMRGTIGDVAGERSIRRPAPSPRNC